MAAFDSSLSFAQRVAFRFLQVGLGAGKYFMCWRQPRLSEGPGSSAELAEEMKKCGVHRALLVTGPSVYRLGLTDGVTAAMARAGIGWAVYDRVEPNPTVPAVEEALALYKSERCDALLAVGGGSPIDCAKGVGARLARPNRSLNEMAGLFRVDRPLPPFFVLPTTAGTGSEVTVAAVLTDPVTHHKYAVNDPHLIPRAAALDPLVTVGLPPKTTATTGLDALTHAVEAMTNRFSAATDARSLEAVRLIFANLPRACEDGGDLAARAAMLKASYLAGAAFTRSGVGYVHAIAHTLGGLYGVPHGLANAVILPRVMELYGPAVQSDFARLAEAAKLPGRTRAAKAEAFLAALYELPRRFSLPEGFDCIRDEDIPQMIRWAMAEANPVYPTPRLWGEREFARAIEKIRL